MKNIHYIARAIVVNDGKILVLQNSADDEHAYARDKWEFPGGTVEHHDDHERAAVKREVREETGLETDIVDELPRVAVTEDNTTYDAAYYLLEADSRDVELSEEHQAYRWIRPKDFIELDWLLYAGYTVPILEQLKDRV